MNVIYDISPIGSDPDRRAGLARVAESMAEQLYRELGEHVSFAATGSLWATLQTEEVLARRDGWRSALSGVGPLARWVHETQRNSAQYAKNANGPGAYGAQVADTLLTQVSRVLNVLRNPVDSDALRRADIFHSSYARIPRHVRRQLPENHLLTVHDLTPLVLGEKYFSSEQIGITRRIIDSVQAGDWVVAVSESTKNDLCERRPIDSERVFVAPNAASDDLFYPVADDQRIRAVRERYSIPEGRYLLSLHSMAPHKNVHRLVNAFREYVSQEQEPDIHLVLAGGLGQSLEEVCERLDLKQADLDRVQFTGFVPDEDLAPLYSGAEAFVFPSLYEGFGLPVLEAMQCGCPVIASNTASIPEVAGEAAILIDPYDEEDLSSSISKVRTDPKTRRRMSTLGIEQARKYSWSKRMETVLGVYDQII